MTLNNEFDVGQILSAAECNNFPFGFVAQATGTSNYTLTATMTIATGMSLTFTPVADRIYKITYQEPFAGLPAALNAFTNIQIRIGSAIGTILQASRATTPAASASVVPFNIVYVGTLTAVSTTIVGTAQVNVTTGAPILARSNDTVARLIVEDIGAT